MVEGVLRHCTSLPTDKASLSPFLYPSRETNTPTQSGSISPYKPVEGHLMNQTIANNETEAQRRRVHWATAVIPKFLARFSQAVAS